MAPPKKFTCFTFVHSYVSAIKHGKKKRSHTTIVEHYQHHMHSFDTQLKRARRYRSACLFLLYTGLFHRLRRVPFQLDRVHVRLQLVALQHLKHLVLSRKIASHHGKVESRVIQSSSVAPVASATAWEDANINSTEPARTLNTHAMA